MKQFIKIESKGIIDPQAFILLGASTKRADDTKIGFFGSGLKYSIAYLLRNNIFFKVYADYREITFSTEKAPFRGTDWDVICINGEKTSMTTEMGLDWEPWFVIREIYCNAVDEGESKVSLITEEECIPIEDKTVFYFEVTPEFKELIENWNLYFSENRKDLVYSDLAMNQIYAGGDKLIVYRKGIRCLFGEDEKCVFNYDLFSVEINESRIIKSEWSFRWMLRGFLQKVEQKNIIAQLLNTVNTCWEKCLGWHHEPEKYSEAWLSVIGDKTLVPCENAGFWDEQIKDAPQFYIIIPSEMIDGLKARFLDKIRVIGDVEGLSGKGEFKLAPTLGRREQALLDDSISFLAKAGYDVKFPMKVVEFSKKEVLGQAKDDTILLSTKLFEKGRKEIVNCIVEEQEHLITGYADETRAFQSHFINKFVSALEEKANTYL